MSPVYGFVPPGQASQVSPRYERNALDDVESVSGTRKKLSCSVSAGVGSKFGSPKRR